MKGFINEIKAKNKEFKAKQDEKKAHSKGFSSSMSFNTYSNLAKNEGIEEAEKELRKKELARIKKEAKEERMLGQFGKYGKIQSKIQRGTRAYNEIVSGLSFNSNKGFSMQNSNNPFQPYAKKRYTRTKTKTKQKTKKRSRKSSNFWDQFINQ